MQNTAQNTAGKDSAGKNTRDSTRDFIREWSLNILILLFGTTTLVQAFIVPTPSMDTTVMVGDHLLVDKLSYAPADRKSVV
jgi:signal peptidase I